MQIEPGDQIRVEVFNVPDLTTTAYVAEDGSIRLPLVGPVAVSGRSPTEAGKRIEAALKQGGFVNDPHVTVTLAQAFRQRVTVYGEVRAPGRLAVEPGATLLDVIALAGGLTDKALERVTIIRTDAAGKQQQIIVSIDSRGMLNAPGTAGAAAMQPVQANDYILVPKGTFTIIGEIKAAGEYRVESGMTVTQAIARAGGVTANGSERRVEIQRTDPGGKSVEVKVRKDTRIEPGDVIKVKERIF